MKKKPASTKQVKGLNKEESIEHYNAVMIEEIHSKMDLLIEGQETLRSEMGSFRAYVDGRFDMAEAAIKCNANAIRELHSKMDHVIDRFDDHEDRLLRIEKVN